MAKQTRRLGRGLNALVRDYRGADEAASVTAAEAPAAPDERLEQVDAATKPAATEATVAVEEKGDGGNPATAHTPVGVSVKLIDPNPMQPRHVFEEHDIGELAHSLTQSGMIQPIVLRQRGKRYQIIAGERRFRAAQQLGWAEVPALVREATEEQMLELALIENIQREDLNAIDRATAYREYCDRFDLRPEEVARKLGEDRSTVSNYLRLLELALPIQKKVAAGQLSMGHARSLLGIADLAERERLADSVVANALSVRALEEIVRRRREGAVVPVEAGSRPARAGSITPHVADLQRRLEESVKSKVLIKEGRRKGSGRIVIQYYSLDDFERIASLLGVELD